MGTAANINKKPEVAEAPPLSLEQEHEAIEEVEDGNSSPYDSEADSDSYSEVVLLLLIRNFVCI